MTSCATLFVRIPPRGPRSPAVSVGFFPGAPTVLPSLSLTPLPCSYLHALLQMRSMSDESIGGLQSIALAPATVVRISESERPMLLKCEAYLKRTLSRSPFLIASGSLNLPFSLRAPSSLPPLRWM